MPDKSKRKPGPDPERLKIDEDPEKALRKLLTKLQPDPDENDDGAGDAEEDEAPETR